MTSVSSSSASSPDYSQLLEAYRGDSKISPFMPKEDLPFPPEERVKRTFNSIFLGKNPLPVFEEQFKQMSAAELAPPALHSHIQEIEDRSLVTCWNAITRYIRHYELCEKTPALEGSPTEEAAVIRNWMEANQPILDQIQDLDISYSSLFTFPPEICRLTHLKHLKAGLNFIASLPPQIRNLKELEDLDLETNCLKEVPVELNHLPNLCNLWLGNNQLQRLPPLNNVKDLSLSGNPLKEISPEIYELMARQNRLHELPNHLREKRKMEAPEERPSKSSKSSLNSREKGDLERPDLQGRSSRNGPLFRG